MQVKGAASDAFRVSVSSAPSTSSQGSAHDDYYALGDVYLWGEISCDASLKGGPDAKSYSMTSRIDVLLPRPLESSILLDVHHVACGVRHAALVTRQGEVFTWGEDSGGCLGHGVGSDAVLPRLVESLAVYNANFVACGEFHTCAVTMTGEVYTWGDGTHNAGLLGHGTNVSHWIPKRVSGPLEGIQVSAVSCGPWHTALITSTGQLFTFGDGTFGVLGHGNRESVAYPREVESLLGLKTVAVSCGVWHTAAVVEVIVTPSNASPSSGKLFTWGDGDKNRLGHGNMEPQLVPTCVPSLIEYNFHKLACGHSLTVGLTTSGHVLTMGSTVCGQLGNPLSDGKLPCLVEDKLSGELVEEIACGSYHVAVMTSKSEVYTWGKGANGRLGHGDVEDRKIPTLVEALKDRHVKYISCGSNFTAVICLHKWVSGAEQPQCSSCRQAFGFTRKRHNCYNCGLVHCHSCSSRKVLRASLSPNPGKPYRVCDSCFVKLNKVSETCNLSNKRNIIPHVSGENKDRLEKVEIKSKVALPPMDLAKYIEINPTKQAKKSDSLPLIRASQVLKPVLRSSLQSGLDSNAISPFSRKPSPARSSTPISTTGGLSFSKSITEGLMKTNELLNEELCKLRTQVESLRQQCEHQESELQKSAKKAQEAVALAAEESAKSKAAKEVIKSLAAQFKNVAERIPLWIHDSDNIRPLYLLNGMEPNAIHHPNENGESQQGRHARDGSHFPSHNANDANKNGFSSASHLQRVPRDYEANHHLQNERIQNPNGSEHANTAVWNGDVGKVAASNRSADIDGSKESEPLQNGKSGPKSQSPTSTGNHQLEAEWTEQYEPGVYITLVELQDGTRDLKRVQFSRKRFGEHQAETWWSENWEKVYERYNVRESDKASIGTSVHSTCKPEEVMPSSQS